MSWFPVDDRLPQLPEVVSIPKRYRLAAIGLWSMGGSWLSGTGAELGYIPDHILPELCGTPMLAGLLVTHGMWLRVSEAGRVGYAETGQGTRRDRLGKAEKERSSGAARTQASRARAKKATEQAQPEDVTRYTENGVTPSNKPPGSLPSQSIPNQTSRAGFGSERSVSDEGRPPRTTMDLTQQTGGKGDPYVPPPPDVIAARGASHERRKVAERILKRVLPPELVHSKAHTTVLLSECSSALLGGADPTDVEAGVVEWLSTDRDAKFIGGLITNAAKRRLAGPRTRVANGWDRTKESLSEQDRYWAERQRQMELEQEDPHGARPALPAPSD